MAKRPQKKKIGISENVHLEGAGLTVSQSITDTLEFNFMPYAMSVIVSRAIPEIDGFKPSHRKLLYTMYGLGLINGDRKKSANIVGATMQLNPHGDQAIYDTMVRLSAGYEALLHGYVDSKGNFGKQYSRDMQCAASRYTEAKLSALSKELFNDIDKDTVDFVDNYDATLKEPTLLPVSFPSVLINANTGMAVGMASNICSFNLEEVCNTTIELIKNNDHDVAETLQAPDLSGGGILIYNKDDMRSILNTGRGSFKIRAKYVFDEKNNCIDIREISNTTTIEAIIEKVIDHVKNKRITEINDIRDETGIEGLKITIDLKRGVDPDKLMQKLFKMTPLEDSFACNFNILIGGAPRVMGVKEILTEWVAFRSECVKRRVFYNFNKASAKLHLLEGLAKILMDIDKAIRIIRETEEEVEVVPNLMIGFGIDAVQAEYVAEIRLRHINKEYILKRTGETQKLAEEIADMQDILDNRKRIAKIIIEELKNVVKLYAKPRKTEIIHFSEVNNEVYEEEVPDYPVTIFFTDHGYFKKITPQSLRMSGEQKIKEDDKLTQIIETTNGKEVLFFTDKFTVYKAKINDFDDSKASVLGDYIPTKLGFDDDENVKYMAITSEYSGYMCFFFDNGKVAKVPLLSYQTKTNRKKLINAYCNKFVLTSIAHIEEDSQFLVKSSSGRLLLFNTSFVSAKTAKDTQGVAIMTQKRNAVVVSADLYVECSLQKPHRYMAKTLPAAGQLLEASETVEQLSLL